MRIIFAIFVMGFIVSVPYAAVPVNKLVLYFPFEEGEGVLVNDVSRNGNDGEIKGDVVWSQDGKYSKALKFNAKDGYILVATSPSLQIDTEVTIMAWIKWANSGDAWLAIMASGKQGGPWETYGMFVHRASKRLYFPVNLQSGFTLWPTNTSPEGTIEPEIWQHICGTYDGDTARIYVDGNLVAEILRESELVPTRMDLRIGHRLGSQLFFSGLMDEVAIFEKALKEDEIKAAMTGLEEFMMVEPGGKLSECWGAIKRSAWRY